MEVVEDHDVSAGASSYTEEKRFPVVGRSCKTASLERLLLDSDFDSVLSQLAQAFIYFERAKLKGAVWHGSTATT